MVNEFRTGRTFIASLAVLAVASAGTGTALAQGAAPAASGTPATAVAAAIGFDKLKGTWVRPDGGYRIVIAGVGADGRIEATYFNPSQLPFAKAQAAMNGAQLRASFELRAGGYDGSTYDLTYDPAGDRLNGVYYQAVIKQKFDVYFVRK
jgi:uncharacterized protein (DUF2147 family)